MKKLFYTRKGNLIICAAVSAAALAVILLISVFKFEIVGIMPPCPFNSLFGIRCAGCGATRGTSALLHGRLDVALYYNPLFTVFWFILIFLFVKFFINAIKKNYTPPKYTLKPWAVVVLTVSIIGFIIIRNLDFYKAIFY